MSNILRDVPDEILSSLQRADLLTLIRGEQQIRKQLLQQIEALQAKHHELQEQLLEIEGRFVTLKNRIFSSSSERTPEPGEVQDPAEDSKPKSKRGRKGSNGKGPTKKLSERYPNLPIVEKTIELQTPPQCNCCSAMMLATEMYESSEYLTVKPKEYMIIVQRRRKYRCGHCHSSLATAPALPRIKPGSAYSDELIVDASLSKYCDLIPIERYCSMARRQGVSKLPPHSLIEASHYLADFVSPAVDLVKAELLSVEVLHADETPHRMLEGDDKSSWYLWGFSTPWSAYYECHDTRSGDVAAGILTQSRCQVLVTDVYSGYSKSTKTANAQRQEQGLPPISNAYCNAHARRKFKEASLRFKREAAYFLEKYSKVYHLEATIRSQGLSPPDVIAARSEMLPIFEEMRKHGQSMLSSISAKSQLAVAINYFEKNYQGLTLFLNHGEVAIDNNAQERLLRSPVIGRKTWYGTHSIRGAHTAAKLFTLIESCKINKVNPRDYFKALVSKLHSGGAPFTPRSFAAISLELQ